MSARGTSCYGKTAAVLFWPALAVVSCGELSPRLEIPSPWDKAAHFTIYCCLAALVTVMLNADKRAAATMAGLVALGVALEFLQSWTGRNPSVLDAIMSAGGVAGGWLAASTFMNRAAAARRVPK